MAIDNQSAFDGLQKRQKKKKKKKNKLMLQFFLGDLLKCME